MRLGKRSFPAELHSLLQPGKPKREEIITGDFSGGTMGKNLPAKGGSMGSIPDLGRFHMTWSNHACVPQRLSPNSRVQELQLLKPTCIKPMLYNKKASTVRRLRITVKSSPRSPPLERDHTKQRRTSTVINK